MRRAGRELKAHRTIIPNAGAPREGVATGGRLRTGESLRLGRAHLMARVTPGWLLACPTVITMGTMDPEGEFGGTTQFT